ncbi:hypothetical protein C1N80_06170 [Brachybacterium sp. SGAir0954]|uniref:hypothetical protein n=1 Tax=Brachybacterium sp. SGAir0954 TaxID=2571029 RepID=UPI0010CCD282|nr:hypothetical protein [Brachybacterium sp. SGAir0954]QCR53206.1 hypothetical protein C1N80_06170 [Brachybacterium sp. SGAir0954]
MELKINRPTKGVELCLDLEKRSQWETLEARRTELAKDPTIDQRLSGGPVTEVAREITQLEKEMAAATVTFTLTALSHREWSRFKTEHPPRKGDKGDEALGFNEETIFDAVIPVSIVSVAGPDGEPVEWAPEKWAPLADEMTTGQYGDFKRAAFGLNLGEAAARLPKSLGASLVMARSDES